MFWTVLAAVGIVWAGIGSVAFVGETGAAAKGETAFTATLVHMAVFYFAGKHWPALSRKLYWEGLVAALVLSFIAYLLTYNENRRWRWAIRIPLALLYVGFLVILFKRP